MLTVPPCCLTVPPCCLTTGSGMGRNGTARIKASQCFTKFKWRDAAVAEQQGGPTIVATQVRGAHDCGHAGEGGP